MSEVTQLIEAAASGDQCAVNRLMPIVYEELRKLAAFRLSREGSRPSLAPTALVHEAYLRILGPREGATPHFLNQSHFFAAASEAMRRILIDRARQRNAKRHGGEMERVHVDIHTLRALDSDRPAELLELDEALNELSEHDEQAAKLIELRFFAGLTHQQAAESLGLSRREADRVWALAKAWLFRRLRA